jgi:hypothetical protein
MIWRVLPLVKINSRISETPCIQFTRKMYGSPKQVKNDEISLKRG